MLSSPSPSSYIRDHLSNHEKLLLGAGPYPTLDAAIADVALATAEAVILRHAPTGLVWNREGFEEIADEYARTLIDEIYGGISLTATVLEEARKARKAIDQAKSLQVLSQVADAASQVDALVYAGFVSRSGTARLSRIAVYLRGVQHRMQQLSANSGRDRAWQNEIDRVTAAYRDAGGSLPLPTDSTEKLTRARWLLEELRISLFAQQLGTAETVSAQRITKILDVET